MSVARPCIIIMSFPDGKQMMRKFTEVCIGAVQYYPLMATAPAITIPYTSKSYSLRKK